AAWEPAGARENSRLGRLIRRRKTPTVASSATRRVVLAVIAPRSQAALQVSAAPGPQGQIRETEVDAFDVGRIRSTRSSAWGRSPVLGPGRTVWSVPAEALVDTSRRDRDRLRNLIIRTVAETANLGPADDTGLAWSAVGLRVVHPDQPHRLTV